MPTRTFGRLFLNPSTNSWVIEKAEPHVCIKLKNIFQKLSKTAVTFHFDNTPDNCSDILWFTQRYPLEISDADLSKLKKGKKEYDRKMEDMERIFLPEYQPRKIELNEGFQVRHYQATASDYFLQAQKMLLGDDIGLGKTLTSLLPMLSGDCLPALIVVQTHVTDQWLTENIVKFTNLKGHIINGRKIYELPSGIDCFIIRYSCLAAWIDVFMHMGFKYIIYDECQELRRVESKKYEAAEQLCSTAKYINLLSATPIFNMGEEIFNILNCANKGCLGTKDDFVREWVQGGYYGNKARPIRDPEALGTYLREQHLMLRRTREEVGLELPPVNKLIYPVEFDPDPVHNEEKLMTELAMSVVYANSFEESFTAGGEFNLKLRQLTGVGKAKGVAMFVRMLLDSGHAVLLGAWHRQVYKIWEEEFKDYNPVFYTGTENDKQKKFAKEEFSSGRSDLLIMSIRSGAGLDGLQYTKCTKIVHGEFDHSPQVHRQFTGRVDRPGQTKPLDEFFLHVDWGSDPVIINRLAEKTQQAHGIMDPTKAPDQRVTDNTLVKEIAIDWLKKHAPHKIKKSITLE